VILGLGAIVALSVIRRRAIRPISLGAAKAKDEE